MAFKVPRHQPIPEALAGWRPRPLSEFNLLGAKELTIDTETYDPDLRNTGPGVRREGEMVGVSIATEDDAFYIPIRHDRQYDPQGLGLPRGQVISWLQDNICTPNVPKLFTNAMYDLDYLAEAGVNVPGPYFDIQINEPLIDENQFSFGLDAQALKYLGFGKEKSAMDEWAELSYGKERDQRKNIYRIPPQLVAPYAIADVTLPQRIHKMQMEIIAEQELTAVWDMENRLIPLMLAMRRRGVHVNEANAARASEHMARNVDRMRQEMGIQDIWNAAQVAKMCDRAGIEYPLTAKTKKPSFVALWLENHEDPRLRMLVQARKYDKTRNTFINGAILGNVIDGKVHTQFNQLKSDKNGTVSGRFSSSCPNLQNIPSRDEEIGPLLRSMFIPDDGEIWYSDDWSQIEFRELVHYGKGPSAEATQQAYRDNPKTDFHDYVASITKIGRKPAKNINFGLGYGMGIDKLAAQLGRTREEAVVIFDMYHERLPFIRDLMKKVMKVAESRGYIRTYMGRRRRFDRWEPKAYSKKKVTALEYEAAVGKWGAHAIKRAFGYAALNALMQGSSADFMKKAMVDIWESGVCDILGAPLLTVHDELNWSVPATRQAIRAHRHAVKLMRDVAQGSRGAHSQPLSIPLLVTSDHGNDWSEAK